MPIFFLFIGLNIFKRNEQIFNFIPGTLLCSFLVSYLCVSHHSHTLAKGCALAVIAVLHGIGKKMLFIFI